MNIDLTPVLQAIIALLAALVTYKLVPWIKAKTTEKQQENIQAAVHVAVYAAEQIFGAGHGEEKLDFALEKLEEAGFNVEKDLVREAIETAVYGLKATPRFADIVGNLTDDKENEEEENDLPPLEEWPLEVIVSFCRLNGIPHEGCETKDEYIRAIVNGAKTEPPDEAGETGE